MDPVKLRNASVKEAELTVGQKDQMLASSIIESQIAASRIELIGRGDRRLLIAHSSFDECNVIGTKAFGYFLHSASWTNCVFQGKFTNCVFGHDPEGHKVVIRDCDFSEADLHVVVYRGGLDLKSCRFGTWPTVVFAVHDLDTTTLEMNGLPPHMLSIITAEGTLDQQWLALDVSKYDDDTFNIYCMLHGQPGVLFHGAPYTDIPSKSEISEASATYLAQMRKYKLYRFWKWITQSVSIAQVELSGEEGIFTLKTGNKPPISLPDLFKVRLFGLKDIDMGAVGFLTEAGNTKSFRLMGASVADDFKSVVLKGHSKVLGTISLTYESMSIERCDGSDDTIESLSEWI